MAEIKPQPGPQEQFLSSSADIVFYGGAAGGGKTWALLLEPLRHIGNKDFGAVIFRRESTQIVAEGGLWDESETIYPHLGADSRLSPRHQWRFPSDAVVTMTHMQHEKDRTAWQGAQIPLIEFDELTHFTRKQFFYMLSRNRSTCGVKPYIRATMNPVPDDDPVGGWVHEFVGWYIGDDGYAIEERSGVVRWFTVVNDELRWADTPGELIEAYPDSEPKSFTFIKSSVYDNKILLAADPGYIANLKALPKVEREQLLGDEKRGGNWKIKPTGGNLFNMAWFEIVSAAPAGGETVRFWDLAASEKKTQGDDPDFTAGIKMRRVGDVFYILDAIEERLTPAKTDELIKNTATQDGKETLIRWEMEGGASGKRDSWNIATMLRGYDARGIRPQGDKVTRAKALSAQSEAGNVKLVEGAWNQRWLRHMHNQPGASHDDLMDASSGAFNELIIENQVLDNEAW